ncbi:ATP-binding protein [Saccharospirillum sp. HFRX-1]|uniref:ATP-binding protein n=1 Tax=unclassified Saccharospirillum TaxID=2633430 RepID=UPI003718DCF9
MLHMPLSHNHAVEHQIQWLRYQQFSKELRPRALSSIPASAIPVLVFGLSAPLWALVFWFACLGIVSVITLVALQHFQRSPPTDLTQLKRWRTQNLYLAILWGLFWATAPWLFFGSASQFQVFVLLSILMLFSAMPSVTLGAYPYPIIYLAFLAPTVLSFTAQFILNSEGRYWLIGPIAIAVLTLSSLISQRKQMEHMRLRVELQMANREAEQAVAEKNRFIATASHDLRQPLQAAALYSGLLNDHKNGPIDPDIIERLDDSLHTVNDLLSHLFDLSAMDAPTQKPDKVAFNLGAWMQPLLQRFTPQAERKGLTLTATDTEMWVETNPQMLSQIVSNLLDNALKYTTEGGVEIKLEQSGHFCLLSVGDSGPGIDADQQARVFEAFYRIADGREIKVQGFGLGLSIVTRLCQRLGIHLQLESQLGFGSRFQLHLPLASQSAIKPTQPMTDNHQPPPALRILLVDDEVTVLNALSTTLVGWDCDVWTARSGEELEQHLATGESFDLLITDDEIDSQTNSDNVIARVHEHQPDVPVVILSGNTALECRTRQREGVEVLFKPVQPQKLAQVLSALARTDANLSKTA